MRRSFLHLCAMLLVASTILTSCRYKELCYEHDHGLDYNLILKLTLDLEIDSTMDVSDEAHTKIHIPTYMVVNFYDIMSGDLKKQEFVGPYGGPLSVTPGTYDMVVYAFDTEWTQERGEGNRKTLEAFTSDITAMKSPLFALFGKKDSTTAPGPIIYTPDHLLVARKRVEIPQPSIDQQVITVEATASTIIETYEFEVTNIDGIEYISSVEAFVTNQARSNFFGRREVNPEPATIYFPVGVSRKKGMLKTTFNTFGKLPGESHSFLNIIVVNSEGKPFVYIADITEQFEDTTHTIVIEDSIHIPAPTPAGGITPTVEEWTEEIHDVPLG